MSQPSSAVKAPSRRSASPHSRIAPAALFEPRCPTVTPRLPRWRPPRGWPAPRRTRSPRALDRGQDREVRAPASGRPVPAAIPAAVPQAPPALPAAEAIGSEFVAQYYAAMHARLDQLHRFYAEDSSLSVAGPAPPPVAATGLRAIDDALRRLAARRARVTVTSVDALHSAHGAVVVVVTGRAIPGAAENEPTEAIATGRGFTQTFVLAPQRNGFYVKNDLVRFLPPEPPEPPRSDVRLIGTTPSLSVKSGPGPNAGPDAGPDAGPEKRAPPALVGESQSLEAVEAKLAAAAARRLSLSAPSGPSIKKDASSKDASSKTQQMPSASSERNGRIEKSRSAPAGPPSSCGVTRRRRYRTRGETATRAPTFSEIGNSESSGNAAVTVRAKPPLASADPRTADKRTAHERGAAGRAVFVRHFPPATTEFDLRATFGAFGAIAADGVTLRASKTQKSETAVEKHAFVAFEDESGFTNTMTAVREGREVLVLGAPVGVEAKREKPPARRGAAERGAEERVNPGRGERSASQRRPAGGARPGGREGEAGRREGGPGRARGRADKR